MPINDNKWAKNTSQFSKYSIENYSEESEEGNFLEVDAQYPEKLHNLHNDLQLLFERIKIEKVEKFVATLHDKKEYVVHMRNSKQTLNHGLVFKKVHRVIKCNQKVSLKPCTNINKYLKKCQKKKIWKYFFKIMNNAFFWKTMRKHRDIKLLTNEARKNCLILETNYNTTILFQKIYYL